MYILYDFKFLFEGPISEESCCYDLNWFSFSKKIEFFNSIFAIPTGIPTWVFQVQPRNSEAGEPTTVCNRNMNFDWLVNLQNADVSRTTAFHKTRTLKNSAKDLGTNKQKSIGAPCVVPCKKTFYPFFHLRKLFCLQDFRSRWRGSSSSSAVITWKKFGL